jgi:hypothetical protein
MVEKKYILGLIIVLILSNILFRLPVTPHQKSLDGFLVNTIANSIQEEKYIKFTINPLSIFGFYPLSYPTGVPILIAQLSSITGINSENIIFLYAIVCSIIAAISMYMLSGNFNKNNMFRFTAAFAYSLSHIFLEWTQWTGNSRALFLAILPLFIYTCMKMMDKKSLKYLILTVILFIMLMTIHRLFIFNIILITTLIVSKFLKFIIEKNNIGNKTIITLAILFLVISTLFGLFVLGKFRVFSYKLEQNSYYDSFMLFRDNGILEIINYYILAIGTLSIFFFIGIPKIILKNKKEEQYYFLLISLGILGLLIKDIQYAFQYSLVIIAIITAYGIKSMGDFIIKYKIIKKATIFYVFIILISFSALSYMLVFDSTKKSLTEEKSWAREDLFYAAMFYKNIQNDKKITSNVNEIIRFNAYSGKPYAPPEEIVYLLNYNITPEDINISFKKIDSYLYDFRNPFSAASLNIFRDSADISYYDIYNPRTRGLINKYNIGYFLENKLLDDKYYVAWGLYDSRFLKSIHEDKNKFYDNGRLALWQI